MLCCMMFFLVMQIWLVFTRTSNFLFDQLVYVICRTGPWFIVMSKLLILSNLQTVPHFAELVLSLPLASTSQCNNVTVPLFMHVYLFSLSIKQFTCIIYIFINTHVTQALSFQETDNLWWDAFATEFFEDDAILTLTFCLEDGLKRYSKFWYSFIYCQMRVINSKAYIILHTGESDEDLVYTQFK